MDRGTNNRREIICAEPFDFYALPAEIRLQILESSDLLAPTREVSWDPVTGYKLPHQDERGTWESPAAMFLVSKAFYADARSTFFRHNQIVIQSHVPAFFRQSEAPVDYAATAFFMTVLQPESFRCLRHLELRAFPLIARCKDSTKMAETAETARKNWFRALQRAHDNGGLDRVRFLRIFGLWHDIPRGIVADLTVLRNFVKNRVWPMIDPEYGPPRLPLQLSVDIQGSRPKRLRYRIRKKGERVYERERDAKRFGKPTVARFVSWKLRHPGDLKGHWVDDGQNGEWIEEGWVRSGR
ncbi:hypothetical protein F5Y10DRAFT_193076 [Nemania abortiva]|nr:hypothetical protein F5Y10DRAFT_193076 [Nemania abortiva]